MSDPTQKYIEIKFGDDQDLSIKQLNDGTLEIKRNSTSDDTYPRLTLSTGDTDIAVNDLLGAIDFKAPDPFPACNSDLILAKKAAELRLTLRVRLDLRAGFPFLIDESE